MKQKGFTLIEMMIVIAIIAILVGIAIPRFKGMQDVANVSKAEAELKTIQIAIESYYMSNSNTYPDTSTTMVSSDLVDASPKIITSALYDPFGGDSVEYNYAKSDGGNYYIVWSVGINGISDITGIDDEGDITGDEEDDIYATNGTPF